MADAPTRHPERASGDPAVVRCRQEIARGRWQAAAVAIAPRLRADVDDPVALHLLATILERSGDLPRAEAAYRHVARLAPGFADAPLALAALLERTGRADAAVAEVEAVLVRAPSHAGAMATRAGLLVRARRFEDAGAAFEALTRAHPDDGNHWLHHGHLLKTLGRIDAAAVAYRRAIATSPGQGAAWWALANMRSVRFDAADVAAMRAALATATGSDRIDLQFAIGHALDGLGEHRAAFDAWREGNALRLAAAPHDAAGTSAGFRRAEALFTPAFLAARSGAGAPEADPIFIVGLPRSGSTLVEQILASHPAVEGLGELHELNHVARAIVAEGAGDSYLDGLAALSPARLEALGRDYLDRARRYRSVDRPFFTDKMPSNWLYAGLIRLILPHARIVDVRRHPMACGFANFAQHYGRGNNFAYDLNAIGRFTADYHRFMAHIDRVAPGAVHRLDYERLVDDPEGEIRRLLVYLKLPFDPACLRFHETVRAVHTPSTGQVRRPIDRAGVDRWKAYAAWLGPLEDGLADR